RNGPVEQGRRRGGRMEVEDDRDQGHRQHQTTNDAKPQFEPYREKRNLVAEALSLPVAAIEIVGEDRQERAEKELKHGCAPRSCQYQVWRSRPLARPARVLPPQERRLRRAPLRRRTERRRSSRPSLRSGAAACRNRADRSWRAPARSPRTNGCG